ncbi:InlB B-repeat-containing protein, partial [Pseudoneobacillus rhizosphaerae]|uniref:InlB B-repeat-containing protein n=1 Tax=Pseudoneobacillus rhizosphaerae TaxID=2880968 RepID=UPI001E60814B
MKRKKGSFWFSIFMIVLLSFSTIQVNADMDISQVDVTAADEIKKTTVHTYGANTWAYSSLAKGPNDELYVAHMINDSEIAVKRWNGATWEPFTSVTKIATADTSLAGPIKLVADANGNLHLAFKFYDGSGVNSYRGVKYGYFNGGTKSWSFTEIEGYSDPNGWKNFDDPSLAVDSSGAVHMVYLYDEAGPHNHYVKYATNQSGTWKIGTMVTSSGGIDELKSPQIVIDNRNNVHVTYIKEDQQNSYYGNVYFTTKKASDTSFPAATKLINSTGDLQDYWSYPLTLDSNGSVYIAYSSLTTSYIVTNASGSWRTEQIYVDHTRITGPLSVHFVGPDIYLLMESWKSDNSEVYFFAMKKTATGWEKGTKNISPAEPGVTSEITYSVDSQGNYMLVMLDRGLRIISSLSGSSAAMGLTTVATPTYSVSYDGNGHTSGNTPTDSKQYKQGDQVTVVGNTGNLQKTGHTFAGWNTASNGTGTSYSPGSSFTMPSNDVILYAKWIQSTYTVSFNSNGGSAVAPVTTNPNTTISAPTPPTRTGYTFNGWFKEASLTSEWNFATDKVTQDTTLYAKWTINQYTVSFNSNGGSAVAPVTTNYNTTISAPTPPTRTGYTFNGWYKEAGLTTGWNFATDKVIQHTTLYAKWTINQYTVSFNSNGGSAVTPVTTNYDTTISAPTPPTRAGYTFNGWFKDAGLSTVWNFATDKVTQDTTLYAKWTINQYTVSFNSNGGSAVAPVTTNYNTSISAPTPPTRTGYTFNGWFKEAGLMTEWNFATDKVTQDTTLFAKWTINQYTVSFNSNGGSAIAPVTTNYNTSITAPTPPTRTGYSFNGWFKEAGLSTVWNFATDKVTQDTTLYAKWTINQYTVSFNSNGGSAVTPVTTNYNTSISDPTPPTRTGYSFNGWFKEAGLTTEWNFATDKVTQDTTLYAKWTINQYTVSFDVDGGNVIASQTVNHGDKAVEPAQPTKTGFTFAGWYTDNKYTTQFDFANTSITSNKTIYVKWSINQYTVSFNSNGGSAVTPVITNYNTSITAPTPPTRTGYTFNGWFKDAGLTTEWDFATDKVTQDTALHAKWTINQYTVSFNSNGGSGVTQITTNYNTSITAPTPPTRTGYTFNGWFKEAGLMTEWNFATDKITQDTTLFAKWTINQYTVSFNSNGGSAVAPVTTNYNTSISAPTPPTRTGYTFNGWFKEAGLITEWDFATDKVMQDTTLFAKWTINQYTVSFNSNGGSAVAPVTTNYNTSISAPTPPTRTGYTFNGWFKEAGLMTEWNFATEKVTQDTTLFAKWTINQYTVSFNSNGGSAVAPVTTNYNTSISAP